jgi:hypothetical protein
MLWFGTQPAADRGKIQRIFTHRRPCPAPICCAATGPSCLGSNFKVERRDNRGREKRQRTGSTEEPADGGVAYIRTPIGRRWLYSFALDFLGHNPSGRRPISTPDDSGREHRASEAWSTPRDGVVGWGREWWRLVCGGGERLHSEKREREQWKNFECKLYLGGLRAYMAWLPDTWTWPHGRQI